MKEQVNLMPLKTAQNTNSTFTHTGKNLARGKGGLKTSSYSINLDTFLGRSNTEPVTEKVLRVVPFGTGNLIVHNQFQMVTKCIPTLSEILDLSRS